MNGTTHLQDDEHLQEQTIIGMNRQETLAKEIKTIRTTYMAFGIITTLLLFATAYWRIYELLSIGILTATLTILAHVQSRYLLLRYHQQRQ